MASQGELQRDADDIAGHRSHDGLGRVLDLLKGILEDARDTIQGSAFDTPENADAIASTLAIVLTVAVLDASAGGPIPATPGDSTTPSESNAARPIAYIDASHLEMGNDRAWSNDGIDGFLLSGSTTGGGIQVYHLATNLRISNNRIIGNQGGR